MVSRTALEPKSAAVPMGKSTTTASAPSTVTSSQNQFSGFDPVTQAALQNLITQLGAGGTAEQKKAITQQDQTRQAILQLLGTYTPEAAR